jgi:hypothetical protein
VCCATKRLVEIRCPSDCVYLAAAREHPSAAAVRQHQHDAATMMHAMRDLNQRQSQLFVVVATFLVRYQAPELQPLVDDDVSEAAAALAATFETASRGVIYDHRPASLSAERLASSLKPVLVEAGAGGGSVFERDAGVVLRRFEEAVRELRAPDASNRRAFLDLLVRITAGTDSSGKPGELPSPPERSSLIVP